MANTGIARHLNEQEISFTRQSVRCDQNVLRVETRNFQIDQLITSIGALHAIREDARDLFKARLQRLDNLLFVTTLLLTVGFGCVLEGTFPPPEAAQENEFGLCVYATLCGLALVFPFFGLLCISSAKVFLNMRSKSASTRPRIFSLIRSCAIQCWMTFKCPLDSHRLLAQAQLMQVHPQVQERGKTA